MSIEFFASDTVGRHDVCITLANDVPTTDNRKKPQNWRFSAASGPKRLQKVANMMAWTSKFAGQPLNMTDY
jgi:hypothetical protein